MTSIAVNTRFLVKNKLEGVGFHIFEILKRLVVQHPSVEFHFIFDQSWDSSFELANNVTCHRIYPPARRVFLQLYWYEFALPRLLKKINPDVFWSPDNFLSLRTDVPSVLTIHDLAYIHIQEGVNSRKQKLYKKYTPLYIHKAKHILAVSQFTKQDIILHFNKDPQDITVCYNGCRDYFKPLTKTEIIEVREKYSDGQPYFIYLGSQHPRKNVSRLIQAFGIFKSQSKSKIKLIIAGRRAWMTEAIDQAVLDNPYRRDIIRIDRYLDGEEAARLVGAAFCLTYPSLFEGFGIPILEGLNCEVPVITSKTSSMPEVGGDAAAYVDPYDVSSITEAMLKIAQDDDYRMALIERSKIQKNKFTWDRTANIVWDVLEKYL